jgi:hypothetical protein
MAALVGVLIAGFVFWNSASPEFKASLAGLVSGSNPADKPQTPAAAGPSGVGLAATPQPDSASTDTARQPSSDLPAASEPPAHRKATGRQAEKIRADNHPVKPGARLIHAFLTVGSTRDEVLSQMGPPTASSDDKLVYGKSELYLKNGCITGWKIDPFANPIRVKLWPDSAVDPTLDFFTIGSTKDDVLVVQGTPTAFSANKYEYAGSVVNFRADQVVSWKSDPGSIPLRARMP